MQNFNQNAIKHKLGLLNLATELSNVSKARKTMGLSRDTFYHYPSTIDIGGVWDRLAIGLDDGSAMDAKCMLELRGAINALDDPIAVLVEQSAMAQRLPICRALARRTSRCLMSLRSHLDHAGQSNIAKKALAAGVRISNCCTHHCPDLPSVSLRQAKQNAACGRGCSTSNRTKAPRCISD